MNRVKFESMDVVSLKKFWDSSKRNYSKFRKIVSSFSDANHFLEKIYFDKLRLELDNFVESFRDLFVFNVDFEDVRSNLIENIIKPVLSGLVNKTVCLKDNLYIYKRGLGVIRPHNVKVSFLRNPVSELSSLSDLPSDFVFDGLSVYQSAVILKLAKFCFRFYELEAYFDDFHFVSKFSGVVYNIYLNRVVVSDSADVAYFSNFGNFSSFSKGNFYDREVSPLACFLFDPSLFDRVVSFQKDFAGRVKRFEDSVRVAFSKELLFKSI